MFVLLFYGRWYDILPSGGSLHIHPQESAYLLSRILLHLGRNVTVGVQCEPSGIMPKQARQGLHIHTILECQRCEGMTQIVEPNLLHGSPLENPSVQQPQDEQKQQIGQKPHEEQKIAEKPMVLEVKYETPQPPKKHYLLTCLAGCAACAILLFLGYIGISAETALPEQRINPEYTALFREYGFEDHTIDFEGKETLASARFYKGGEIAGVTATSQELGITVTEYILEDGILVETVRYNYKPFNVFDLKKTAQEREELVATQARIAKDVSTTTEYAVYDDYYVLIHRYHGAIPFDREQVKAIIAGNVAYGSIAREID